MNKTNAHLFLPFVVALKLGKDITFRGQIKEHFTFEGDPEDYAIVEPPKPVPLTYEDMEPGCHLRFSYREEAYAVVRYTPDVVGISGRSYAYAELIHAEIYRPSTRTWSPAHK